MSWSDEQDLSAERSVICALMLGADHTEAPGLTRTSFQRAANGVIYDAIVRIRAGGGSVDLITLTAELRRTGELDMVGGVEYLSNLLSAATTSANFATHAKLVEKTARHRELRKMALVLLGELDSTAVPEDIQAKLRRMSDLASIEEKSRGPRHISEILAELKTTGVSPAVPMGIEKLSPLRVVAGDLCVIGARTGCGKTAMLGTLAINASAAGWQVLMFSLEMAESQIGRRFDNAGITEDTVIPVWVEDDSKFSTLEAMWAYAKAFTHLNADKNTVIIIDYLQLIRTQQRIEKRYELIGHVCRELKLMARSLKVPIIVAAQLSRAVETRGKDARPQLSDLRESGEIEQTADQILLMHREENKTLARVAKYRMGARFTTEIFFNPTTTTFEDHEWL